MTTASETNGNVRTNIVSGLCNRAARVPPSAGTKATQTNARGRKYRPCTPCTISLPGVLQVKYWLMNTPDTDSITPAAMHTALAGAAR
jgi:hypothetical protein